VVVTRSNFVITGSMDGCIMFWTKKAEGGIEFVKKFRAHLGAITGMAGSADGLYLATASDDMSLKIYDVLNFDMMNMMKLPYQPGVCEWLHKAGDANPLIAVAEADGPKIRIYQGRGTKDPVHEIDLHNAPITDIKCNPKFNIAVSTDIKGFVHFWASDKGYGYPKQLKFKSYLDTDLFSFVQAKAAPWGVCFSPNGQLLAAMASDRKVRVFKVATGKLFRVYDESIDQVSSQYSGTLHEMELGRRLAEERDLERSSVTLRQECPVFNETSDFLMYPTLIGVKCVNLTTNKCSRLIGKGENMRCLKLALFQGIPQKKDKAGTTMKFETADNPGLRQEIADPILFCSAVKKSRFFLFTRREPEEDASMEVGRDVFNIKPTREEQLAASGVIKQRKMAEFVTIHTSMGDITISLFLNECPKTVENFVTLCRDGYYNNLIFHRVIQGFMIQTGCPYGDGTGGESIWGGEFEDEFNPALRHDRPYTVSMANAGPNTNGSQFFITLTPQAHLDNKHTVFGRVSKGMETCQDIGNAPADKKVDKPYEDIKIINVSVK